MSELLCTRDLLNLPAKPQDSDKPLWLERLADWEAELSTNRHGMQYLAARAVKVLKADIEHYWPSST